MSTLWKRKDGKWVRVEEPPRKVNIFYPSELVRRPDPLGRIKDENGNKYSRVPFQIRNVLK